VLTFAITPLTDIQTCIFIYATPFVRLRDLGHNFYVNNFLFIILYTAWWWLQWGSWNM